MKKVRPNFFLDTQVKLCVGKFFISKNGFFLYFFIIFYFLKNLKGYMYEQLKKKYFSDYYKKIQKKIKFY